MDKGVDTDGGVFVLEHGSWGDGGEGVRGEEDGRDVAVSGCIDGMDADVGCVAVWKHVYRCFGASFQMEEKDDHVVLRQVIQEPVGRMVSQISSLES